MEVSPEKDIKGSFVIDRNIWLRGEGGTSSYLLRVSDDKMCCVGFFAVQCKHVSPKDLLGLQVIEDLVTGSVAPLGRDLSSEDELVKEFVELEDILIHKNIYTINDLHTDTYLQPDAAFDPGLILPTEEARENLLTQRFAEIGYKLTFIN